MYVTITDIFFCKIRKNIFKELIGLIFSIKWIFAEKKFFLSRPWPDFCLKNGHFGAKIENSANLTIFQDVVKTSYFTTTGHHGTSVLMQYIDFKIFDFGQKCVSINCVYYALKYTPGYNSVPKFFYIVAIVGWSKISYLW